jgi:hypothetical protein
MLYFSYENPSIQGAQTFSSGAGAGRLLTSLEAPFPTQTKQTKGPKVATRGGLMGTLNFFSEKFGQCPKINPQSTPMQVNKAQAYGRLDVSRNTV